MKSIVQSDKRCFVCGSTTVHKHHVFSGANRKNSEDHGCWVYLCPRHHNGSDNGVHFNKMFDTYLKQFTQRKFEETHTREEFMKIFKKNYL